MSGLPPVKRWPSLIIKNFIIFATNHGFIVFLIVVGRVKGGGSIISDLVTDGRIKFINGGIEQLNHLTGEGTSTKVGVDDGTIGFKPFRASWMAVLLEQGSKSSINAHDIRPHGTIRHPEEAVLINRNGVLVTRDGIELVTNKLTKGNKVSLDGGRLALNPNSKQANVVAFGVELRDILTEPEDHSGIKVELLGPWVLILDSISQELLLPTCSPGGVIARLDAKNKDINTMHLDYTSS